MLQATCCQLLPWCKAAFRWHIPVQCIGARWYNNQLLFVFESYQLYFAHYNQNFLKMSSTWIVLIIVGCWLSKANQICVSYIHEFWKDHESLKRFCYNWLMFILQQQIQFKKVTTSWQSTRKLVAKRSLNVTKVGNK
jgi:hypothetical protein